MQNIRRRRIFPTFYADSIRCVTPEFILNHGFKAVLVDIDNTLSHVDAPDAVPEGELWMTRVRESGIHLAFVSNNDPPRVEPFAEKYQAEYVCHAVKPKPDGFFAIAERLKCRREECLVIGDQLFTDIMGGNAAGMTTVIVNPICEAEDPLDFRKRRRAEKLLLRVDRRLISKKRYLPKVEPSN